MLTGIELALAVAAIVGGIVLFIVAVRRRPARGVVPAGDGTTAGIVSSNAYSLAVIALLFFGIGFLIDVLS